MYVVDYGSITVSVCGDLNFVKKVADMGAGYTREPIVILDSHGNELARREWRDGVRGIRRAADPLRFADVGFFDDWQQGGGEGELEG